MATTADSCVLSSRFSTLPRGSSVRAASNPRATYRLPTRPTSRGNDPTTFAVARAEWPASRSSSTRTRRQVRADIWLPWLLRAASVARSFFFNFRPPKRVPCSIPVLDQTEISPTRAAINKVRSGD